MHRASVAALIVLFFISIPYLSFAIGFGGIITDIQPCDEGELLYVEDPFGVVIPYMWYAGELPFAFYIPPHIGQELLGEYYPTPSVCEIDGETMGEGFPILFHGESI